METFPPPYPGEWNAEEDAERGDAGRVDAIREALRRSPKPSVPQDYNVEEAEFWRTRHVPPGSVLVFRNPSEEGGPGALVAVLVDSTESLETGMWVSVRVVGAETAEERKRAQGYFKSHRRRIHICYETDGQCPEGEEPGLHLKQFTWVPPGDFAAHWLTSHGKKMVQEGKKMELEKRSDSPRSSHRDAGGDRPRSRVEERLSALRKKDSRRVSFGPEVDRHEYERDKRHKELGAGRSSRAGPEGRAPDELVEVKKEINLISDESAAEESASKKKKKKKRNLSETLIKAAKVQNVVVERKEKKRSRSRSRGRKRRKRKSRHSDSDSQSDSSKESSSSSESLVAPLKRRSQKEPGSVYKILETQAIEGLAADGIVEEGYEASGLRGQRPKLHTYFQIVLKPALDARGRDCKELAMLTRSLDLLRDGRLAELADVLASRVMAVDASTRQGWATARHLEVFTEGEEGVTPAHVLLSAQKHARTVEKAGGKGSWVRPAGWTGGSWAPEGGGKGKAKENKGKGKKGKGKGKGAKNYWGAWNEKEKPGGEKPKKNEGET
eukprot:s2759_g12.t1